MPPSTLSSVRSTPESAFIASSTSRVWNAVASRTARAMWPLLTYRVRPTSAPRASERQYGANRPENAGTKYAPPLSSTVLASSSISGAARDQAEVVAEPLHQRAGDRDRPLERVHRRLVADLVADRGEQAVLRRDRLGAGVEQHEVAGAVRVLGLARPRSRPGRRWPPAGRRGCRRSARRTRPPFAARAVHLGRRPDLRQHRQRDAPCRSAMSSSQLSVSRSISMRAGRVGGVGDVHAAVDAAGHVPQHPRVDVAERQVAGLRLLPGALDVVEDPADLRAGEVRRQRQADLGLVPVGAAAERTQLVDDASASGCPARRSRCRPARRWSGPRPRAVSRWLVMPTAAMSCRPEVGRVRRGRRPRGCCPRSPPRRARPSRPAGRSARAPSGRTATIWPDLLKTIARELVVPWSMARTYLVSAMVVPSDGSNGWRTGARSGAGPRSPGRAALAGVQLLDGVDHVPRSNA